MSKAELYKQLDPFTVDELRNVVLHVEEVLNSREDQDQLTPAEQAIIEQRMQRFERDGNSGEDWDVVRERVLGRFKK